MSFDAYNECDVPIVAIERYFERTGHYQGRILTDKIYRNKQKTEYKDNVDRVAEIKDCFSEKNVRPLQLVDRFIQLCEVGEIEMAEQLNLDVPATVRLLIGFGYKRDAENRSLAKIPSAFLNLQVLYATPGENASLRQKCLPQRKTLASQKKLWYSIN